MADENKYNESFCPKPIADLVDGKHIFVIPSFQRGYRWEEKQVLDLLNDIKQFADKSTSSSDSYFLQPVVVKRTTYDGDNAWEVLDGQQRLTTLLLILNYVVDNLLSPIEKTQYSEGIYRLVYKNRQNLDFKDIDPKHNIDSFYLYMAKKVIEDWFSAEIKAHHNLDRFKSTLLYNDALQSQVKIIWYAVPESDSELVSIRVFNRLNKGKISLTSSELIKALFIMDEDKRSQGNPLPAEQLAMEWNEMERKFQNDNFWYFIANSQADNTQTRIDLLFDFVAARPVETDSDYSYRRFQNLYDYSQGTVTDLDECWINASIKSMEDAWKLVKRTFDRLEAWYDDNMYYHYVGYLAHQGRSPLDIYNAIDADKLERKSTDPNYEWTIDDTELSLKNLIMETSFKKSGQNDYLTPTDIDSLEYGSEYVARLLLLFNVEFCRQSGNTYFAFDRFRKTPWDVEHVDSRNESSLQTPEDRLRWLKGVRFILNIESQSGFSRSDRAKELFDQCTALIDDSKDNKIAVGYDDFYKTVVKYFSADSSHDEKDIDLEKIDKNSIGNLTLLDSSTNREYKDAPFPYKRYLIIDYDKKGERFIPVCTRNLFLKYYSDSNTGSSQLDLMRWNEQDRSCYLDEIHRIVDPILNIKKTKKEKNNA